VQNANGVDLQYSKLKYSLII